MLGKQSYQKHLCRRRLQGNAVLANVQTPTRTTSDQQRNGTPLIQSSDITGILFILLVVVVHCKSIVFTNAYDTHTRAENTKDFAERSENFLKKLIDGLNE